MNKNIHYLNNLAASLLDRRDFKEEGFGEGVSALIVDARPQLEALSLEVGVLINCPAAESLHHSRNCQVGEGFQVCGV